MLIQQAFRFELMPTGQQRRQMRRFAGACRFVFNEALRLQQATRAAGGKYLSYESLAKRLTAWRAGEPTPSGRQAPWLKEAPVHALQLWPTSKPTRCARPLQRPDQPARSPGFNEVRVALDDAAARRSRLSDWCHVALLRPVPRQSLAACAPACPGGLVGLRERLQ